VTANRHGARRRRTAVLAHRAGRHKSRPAGDGTLTCDVLVTEYWDFSPPFSGAFEDVSGHLRVSSEEWRLGTSRLIAFDVRGTLGVRSVPHEGLPSSLRPREPEHRLVSDPSIHGRLRPSTVRVDVLVLTERVQHVLLPPIGPFARVPFASPAITPERAVGEALDASRASITRPSGISRYTARRATGYPSCPNDTEEAEPYSPE
jgi:hypothetical protein